MKPKLRNIAKYTLAALLAFNVLFLNFGFPVCIGMTQDDCCHKVQNVPKCCEHKAISQKEQIRGHCGCEIKDANGQVDLYSDISIDHKQAVSSLVNCEAVQNINIIFHNALLITTYHSPPILYGNGIYLSNLNLRI